MHLRIFGFGELAGGPWGAGWIPDEPDQAGLLGWFAEAGASPPRLDGEQASEPWHLAAGDTELTLEGLGEPVSSEGPDHDSGFDQLCRITGVLAADSGSRNINSLGWRSARTQPLGPGRLDSLRQVAGWFDEDDGFALLALRPKGERGQERDQVSAAVFGPSGAKQVADPRLSTTYDASEQPARASVELWVETEGDSETQYPQRAIGEAVAPPVQARAGQLVLEGRPFHWYSGGGEGAGLYLIGRVG